MNPPERRITDMASVTRLTLTENFLFPILFHPWQKSLNVNLFPYLLFALFIFNYRHTNSDTY